MFAECCLAFACVYIEQVNSVAVFEFRFHIFLDNPLSVMFNLFFGRFEPAAFPCFGQEFPPPFPVNWGDVFGVALGEPAQGLCVFVQGFIPSM